MAGLLGRGVIVAGGQNGPGSGGPRKKQFNIGTPGANTQGRPAKMKGSRDARERSSCHRRRPKPPVTDEHPPPEGTFFVLEDDQGLDVLEGLAEAEVEGTPAPASAEPRSIPPPPAPAQRARRWTVLARCPRRAGRRPGPADRRTAIDVRARAPRRGQPRAHRRPPARRAAGLQARPVAQGSAADLHRSDSASRRRRQNGGRTCLRPIPKPPAQRRSAVCSNRFKPPSKTSSIVRESSRSRSKQTSLIPKRQRAISTSPTEDPALNKTSRRPDPQGFRCRRETHPSRACERLYCCAGPGRIREA